MMRESSTEIGAPSTPDRSLEEAAKRIHRRYCEEIVEAFGFCPWALGARRDGRISMWVDTCRSLDAGRTGQAIAERARDDRIDVVLVLFPLVTLARRSFEAWVDRVRDAQTAAGRSAFALAAFHPQRVPLEDSRAAVIRYLRRSPDPAIQLVRLSALERVRRGHELQTSYLAAGMLRRGRDWPPPPLPLHEQVRQTNIDTLRRAGTAAIEAVWADIEADRARAYSAFLDESDQKRLGIRGPEGGGGASGGGGGGRGSSSTGASNTK